MKIYAISDLHLCISGAKPMEIFGEQWANYLEKIEEDWRNKVTDDDVVLIAGDLSWAMKMQEAQKDFDYLKNLPGTKIIIRGNHDYWWQSVSKVRQMLPKQIIAIQNDAMRIGDFIFCGTRGWTVPEKDFATEEDKKIYDRELIRLDMSLNQAKSLQTNNEKIIALIHYPPFNSKRTENDFTALFDKYEVSDVVYGHLHGKICRTNIFSRINNTSYHLTSCDQVDNKLIELY